MVKIPVYLRDMYDAKHLVQIAESCRGCLLYTSSDKREKSHGGGKCHQNGKAVAENATK